MKGQRFLSGTRTTLRRKEPDRTFAVTISGFACDATKLGIIVSQFGHQFRRKRRASALVPFAFYAIPAIEPRRDKRAVARAAEIYDEHRNPLFTGLTAYGYSKTV